MVDKERDKPRAGGLGEIIRTQRKLANLSLRQMAEMTSVSNAYLSQIERGLHEPSVRVVKAIANALNVSAETLLTQGGILEPDASAPAEASAVTEAAIRADPALTSEQKQALIGVYRSYVAGS